MLDLDKLLRLREAATPGPWSVKIGDFEAEDGYGTVTAPYIEADGKMICVPFDRDPEDENDEDDAAYIVAACNAVPDLVSWIRELEAQRDWMAHAQVHGDEMMTGNKEYDVAEMLAKMCIRNECKEKTCPVGSAMDCPFYPELLCGDITSEDWLIWMYEKEKK